MNNQPAPMFIEVDGAVLNVYKIRRVLRDVHGRGKEMAVYHVGGEVTYHPKTSYENVKEQLMRIPAPINHPDFVDSCYR